MSAFQELRGLLRLRVLQLAALIAMLTLIAAIAFSSRTTVRDPDIWWHLKVGDWIVQHHAVPYVGIFSRTAATLPWIAYSWGYEVMLSRAYAWFGLTGFSMFGVWLTVGVAFTLFWMLHRLCGRFWLALILSLIGSFSYLFSLMPRPVFFTMILFTIVLTLLLEAQRSSQIKVLYWLPLLFVVWANLHIQFLYGLFVVGLYVGVHLVQKLVRKAGIELDFIEESPLPLGGLFGIFFACLAATLVGPYNYHLIRVVQAYTNSHVPYFMIQELAAFDFNFFTHYVLLLLTAAAFYAVGWRRKLDLFKLSLLIVASIIAFRTQRDAWFLGIAATTFIADLPNRPETKNRILALPELAGTLAVLAVVVLLVGKNYGVSASDLDRAISHEYPVKAVNFVRQNPVPGPLYNSLDWGGFLIWYMPQYPVAVDGRNDLYGDDIDLRTFKSVQGDSYTEDPYLNEAGLVLLPKKTALAQVLTIDNRFHLIYQDQLAMVFARNQPGTTQ
jgi:hypothetical protein